MTSKKIKWLIYTVMVGLIPVAARLLIYVASANKGSMTWLSAADVVAFGLVLHISNINELEHATNAGNNWKTIQNGTSIVFISVYSMLFAISLIADNSPGIFDARVIKIASVVLSIASFSLSYSIFDRLSKKPFASEKSL